MTRDDALKLIPPGWVECDKHGYVQCDAGARWTMDGYDRFGSDWIIYAIPAPKPEPRRVPMGGMSLWCDSHGRPSVCNYWMGRAYHDYANSRWKPDFDTREWVEVLE